MIIQLSGRKRVGKDTAADLIQYLIAKDNGSLADTGYDITKDEFIGKAWNQDVLSGYERKSYAHKIKVHIANVLGVSLSQMDNEEWRSTKLINDEWGGYLLTPRLLMQKIGTEIARNIHPDYWVNALMVDYHDFSSNSSKQISPNWCISDCRFPNEVLAVERLQGITIRIERDNVPKDNHPSESALDDYSFKYVIKNNGSIIELMYKLEQILKYEKILKP